MSRTSVSVSRDAVPLPIAIRSAIQLRDRAPAARRRSDPAGAASTCRSASTAPVRDSAATFTPVRKPGSSPMTTRSPAGAREQQLLEVAPEDRDRLFVGLRLELEPEIDLDRRERAGACTHPARRAPSAPARLLPATKRCSSRAGDLLDGRVDRADEKALVLAAAHREHAMRRQLARAAARSRSSPGTWRLRPSCAVVTRDFITPFRAREVAHLAAHVGVVGDALGQDVARAGERVLHVGHFLLGARRTRPRRSRGCGVGARAATRARSASGSRPRSRAIVARVRRFGLYGR